MQTPPRRVMNTRTAIARGRSRWPSGGSTGAHVAVGIAARGCVAFGVGYLAVIGDAECLVLADLRAITTNADQSLCIALRCCEHRIY
eukprot:1414795-Prymnesium_polylepis.1